MFEEYKDIHVFQLNHWHFEWSGDEDGMTKNINEL